MPAVLLRLSSKSDVHQCELREDRGGGGGAGERNLGVKGMASTNSNLGVKLKLEKLWTKLGRKFIFPEQHLHQFQFSSPLCSAADAPGYCLLHDV